MKSQDDNMQTFGDHLEVLRHVFFRIAGIIALFSVLFFSCKEFIWDVLLAPSESTFCLYSWIENVLSNIGYNYKFDTFEVELISTELASQFMTHLSASIALAIVFSAPYILYELFHYVSPALYANEKSYARITLVIVYLFFSFGILTSYYLIFPLSFRFLSTFSISERVHTTITIDSYISSFTTISLLMGIFFQLPIVTFFLAKYDIISSKELCHYRKHSLIIIMIIAAIITPPDIMTLLIVTVPLYLLFETSLFIMKFAK